MNRALLRRIETNDQFLEDLFLRSEPEVRLFINAVQDNSNIRSLSIRDTVLAPDTATALSAVLPRISCLKDFVLCNCDCSNNEGLSFLASALASRDSLKKLRLHRCRIRNRGAEIIASFLGSNSTKLEYLILSNNSIGNEGAIAIASLLSGTSSITCANFYSNVIGADGMSALATSLCQNQSIKNLVLDGNADEPNTHFKRVLYNDASIDSVVSSNHTLQTIYPRAPELESLLELNYNGPAKAVRSKIIRFLNEQPTYVLTMGLEGFAMPSYMETIGRDCRLNTMFELIRNLPGLLEGRRKRPYRQCRKRSWY